MQTTQENSFSSTNKNSTQTTLRIHFHVFHARLRGLSIGIQDLGPSISNGFETNGCGSKRNTRQLMMTADDDDDDDDDDETGTIR